MKITFRRKITSTIYNMTSDEGIELFSRSPLSLCRSNISGKKNNIREKTSKSNVISRHCRYTMQTFNLISILLILFTSVALSVSNCLTYDSRQHDFELSPLKSRTKRWASEEGEAQSNQKQQASSIPAANPNFEAAFQGECGKNNNSNPCEHICLDLHDGTYECSCFYGFALAVDGYSCATLDKSPLSAPSSSSSSFTSLTASSTSTPSSTLLATLLLTNKQQNKLVQGDLEGGTILNQNKVVNLTRVGSRAVGEAQRRGLDLSDQFKINSSNEQETNRSTSKSSSSLAEIDQTSNGEEFLENFQATKNGRVSDSRKLADSEFEAKGTILKDNEIASKVGGENKKPEADYLVERKAKVGGELPDVKAARRRRQRRLLTTAADWISQKVAQQRMFDNRNSDSSYKNNISGNNDEDNYDDSSPPNEKSYFAQTQQQNSSYQLSEQPVMSEVAEQANIAQVSAQEEEAATTRATITKASSGIAITSETAPKYSNGNNNNNKVGHHVNHWTKYDVEVDQKSPNKDKFIRLPRPKEQENNNDNDDTLVDSDIQSIMISNDKLVKQLADLVSVASLTILDEDSKDDYDGDEKEDNEQDRRLRDKTVEMASQQPKNYREIELEAGNDSGKTGQEQAAYHHKASEDFERGVDEGSDDDLNLLEDLVRKTFEDQIRKQRETTHLEGSNKQEQNYLVIDRDVPNELHRSWAADENGSQALKSSKHRRSPPKSTKLDFIGEQGSDDNNRIKEENEVDEEGFYPRESPLSLNENRVFDSERGVLGLDFQNSIKRDINDRLCAGERDNFDYRDCWDLPECESGGKCIIETKWFYNNSSPNLVLQFQTSPRCQCPIGRGGFSCQKRKSYLALPMIKDSSLSNLHFLFRPFGSNWEQEQTSLLLYSEKFLLLLDDLSRVELRYITQDSGSKITRVIGSRDAEINKWNELLITNDASSDDSSQIVSNSISPEVPMNRIVLVLPDKIRLQDYQATNNTSPTQSMELFVAGVPDAFRSKGAIKRQHSSLTMDKENLGGFSGCIRELNLNKRAYNFRSDLNGDTLDGFDIGECCTET